MPIPHVVVPTSDSESFRSHDSYTTGLPLPPHPGAYGVKRKHHTHEGVDFYVPIGTPVTAVEAGVVTKVDIFTGPELNQHWWHPTKAVWVDGASGTVVYGEIAPHVKVGQVLEQGELIGVVLRVLTKNKGRPTSMLHLELHDLGSRSAPEWKSDKPPELRDPTPHLMECIQ